MNLGTKLKQMLASGNYKERPDWEIAFEKACEVFGDYDDAERWMNRNIRSLGGTKPKDLCESKEGFQQVMDTLVRIETGVIG